jgi:uncharacterized membrane protein
MPIPAYLWHPIFVHFSVALLTVATLFYLLAVLFPRAANRTRWIDFARWNLWGGSGLSVLTVLLGWLAYNTVSHDNASHEAMEIHATLALITLTAFGSLAVWSLWNYWRSSSPSRSFTVLVLVAFGFLVATGLRGGELVFHYGLAVSSLPKPDGEAVQLSEPASPTGASTSEKERPPAPNNHHHEHGRAKHAE